jgi:hypothetical protein
MRLHVEARLDYDFPEEVESLLHLEVAHGPGQAILAESLTFDPPLPTPVWTTPPPASDG